MRLFVNLPLSYAAREPRYIDMLINEGISPELGMDTFAVQELDANWHKQTAARFADAGLDCAIHLPFFDLSPGSLNNVILEASRNTLLAALDLSQCYTPKHFVGHPFYQAGQHASFYEEWLSRSLVTWQLFLKETDVHIPLYLENTYENSPYPLVDVMAQLPEERAGFCFDVGHWYSFAGGAKRNNLKIWLNSFADRLGHLHLHDNDGSDDQHRALGDGTVPLLDIFDYVQANELTPSATLEPHEEDAFAKSIAFLEAHSTSLCFLSEEEE